MGPMGPESLLQMKGISKAFFGVQALDNVDLSVNRGEIHGLVGENGAGKSTLIKILAGAETRDSGKVVFKGKPLEVKNPMDALAAGIVVIYQELSLIPNMEVCENMLLGREPRSPKWKARVDWKRLRELARARLGEMGVHIDPRVPVAALGTGEQQIVEIARALETDADIILMDEPTSALSSHEVDRLFRVIRSLKEAGKTVIYISHRLEEVMQITDRITVLRDGKVIGTVETAGSSIPEIVTMMLGASLQEVKKRESGGRAGEPEPVLEVRDISRGRNLRGVSFTLHKGEILGVTGLMGAGKTELARALFGIDPAEEGEILVAGRPVRIESPSQALALGIGLVPEDRKRQGLFLNRPLVENLSICSLDVWSKWGVLLKRARAKSGLRLVKEIDIKTSGLDQLVSGLSGGNQQKVAVGKWLAKNVRVLMLDEPTRGIDVGSKPRIHAIMRRLADRGLGIITMSSEVPEICRICDRVLVLSEGKVVGEFAGQAVQEKEILSCVAGGAA